MYKSLRWYLEFKDIVENYRLSDGATVMRGRDNKKTTRRKVALVLCTSCLMSATNRLSSCRDRCHEPWQLVSLCVTPPPRHRDPVDFSWRSCVKIWIYTQTQKTHRPVCHCEKRPEVCNLKYIFFLVIQGKSLDCYSITTHKQIGSCISHK